LSKLSSIIIMRISTVLSPVGVICFCIFLYSTSAWALQPTTHTINFGGILGHHYSPSRLTVEVGDTIIWNGDFSQDNMVDSSHVIGAASIGPVTAGMTYTYIVQTAGTYYIENPIWAKLGMRDTITAVFRPHGSLTNEGREFYLGMLFPTYNYIVPKNLTRYFHIYALITAYYTDTLYISYFDNNGNEKAPLRQVLGARQMVQFELDVSQMMDTTAETAVYKSCHIVSKHPISVQYLSKGANSGGSYLALPVMAVGKNYVVASYNDDATQGALTGQGFPSVADIAGGDLLLVACNDGTSVYVTPATATTGGHARGKPFNVTLSKGQCFLVRSDGSDASHDLSGTLVQSDHPVIVISGHEDAYLGDASCATAEARDFMIEQMTPVEYWDTIGYMGVPFVEGTGGNCNGGKGDTYRVYTFDPGSNIVQADVQGISGGYNLSTSQLNYGSQSEVQGAVDIYSKNGHKISVMQYDERTQPSTKPFPAPSMMTIVPHSRWRKSYNIAQSLVTITGSDENQYVNIISDSLTTVKASAAGAAEQPLSSAFFQVKAYNFISSYFTSSKGGAYTPQEAKPYFLHSDYPFACYLYGMSHIGYSFGRSNNDFQYEYATPAGMQLNTGAAPTLKVTTSLLPNCAGWSVCVTDTGSNNPGIKGVMLVDDPDGVYFDRPGVFPKNVSFDVMSPDYTTLIDSTVARFPGELHPNVKSNEEYCFTILRNNRLTASTAPIGLIDNNGNGLLIQLHSDAPAFSLSSQPINPGNPDSIYFPTQNVGTVTCDTIVVHNSASANGASMMFTGVNLVKKGDGTFTILSTIPTLPASIKPQDSLVIAVCSKLTDAKRHTDTLVISNDCFDIPVLFDSRGATGTIVAEDLNFGNVDVGLELCKAFVIHNTGTQAFTLYPSPPLSDNVNFAIDQTFLGKLPMTIQPGQNSGAVKVCFHPQKPGADSAVITWATDIDPSFSGTGKNYSTLRGSGLDTKGVHDFTPLQNSFTIRPNPDPGNTAIVTFSLPSKQRAIITIYDVLGRELFQQNYMRGSGEFEIPISYLQQGVYYVRLTSDDIVLTQKLEVQR
jgi:plastocyanin